MKKVSIHIVAIVEDVRTAGALAHTIKDAAGTLFEHLGCAAGFHAECETTSSATEGLADFRAEHEPDERAESRPIDPNAN